MTSKNSICDERRCTACGACLNICKKEAIKFNIDKFGRTIAYIDKDKCVDCGLCKQVCPMNGDIKAHTPQKCFAALSKSDEYKKKCASGGLASELAKYVIANGGIYYAVRFDDEFNLRFDSTENEDEILSFSGSKYVQADTGFIYRDIKDKLNSNRLVLFTGTPCQVAGLKNYLGKDIENLITVDLICHGVPPIQYLKEHAKTVVSTTVAAASFRGEHNFQMTFYNKSHDIVYKKISKEDVYFAAFLEGLIHRSNCYECNFATEKRVSDITIGDFWGVDKSILKECYDGRISVVLVNTDKGGKVLESLQSKIIIEERSIAEAVKNNGQLQHPSKKHPDRSEFEHKYLKYGFEKAADTKTIRNIRNKYRNKNRIVKVKRFLKNMLGR